MSDMFEEKVALVTGGASGIGEACVKLFAEQGARLLVVDLNAAAGEKLVGELRAQGTKCQFVRADVTDEPQVETMVRAALENFGRLDIAVNNAGISGPMTPLEETPLEGWHQIIAVNLTSVFLCTKHELKVMKTQGRGAIVNVSSGAGLVGTPHMVGYSAAKHGVLGITKTAAQENIKSKIRVNAVLPGSTLTPMMEASLASGPHMEQLILNSIPCGRFGEPGELAHAIVWLCSEHASYVNGHSLIVDGGTLCR